MTLLEKSYERLNWHKEQEKLWHQRRAESPDMINLGYILADQLCRHHQEVVNAYCKVIHDLECSPGEETKTHSQSR